MTIVKNSKKIALVITDGVGFRNFVMSDFILEIENVFDSVSIYSGLPDAVFENIKLSEKTKIFELALFNEKKSTWFFRKWKEIAHLTKFRSFAGMNENLVLGYPKNNHFGSIFIKIVYAVTKFWHSNTSILFAEKMQFSTFSNHKVTRSYFQLIRNDQPDLVFFTHQRPSYLAPLLHASIKMKIKTATFIFSWDNLASKGRMLGSFDYFLVWSDLMQSEMLHFYDEVDSSQITVVGTPQFEPYVLDRFKTDKLQFFKKFKLIENQKIVCYSCADATIGANDSIVIAALAEAIRKKDITGAQLLVRTSPAELPDRFQNIIDQYPEIKWNFPKWSSARIKHTEAWSQRIPSQEDIADLRAILEFSDLSVNMCSTMSLDFMLFDKPVINTVFGNKQNGLFDDQRFLGYDHFKKVVDSQAVMIAKDANELVIAVNNYLQNPALDAVQRSAMIKLQISKPLAGTSKRIAKALSKIANV